MIDWELQVIGDPMYDVAYVLSDLNREGSPLLSCLVEREFFHRLLPAAHWTGYRFRGLPLLRHTIHDAQHGVLAECVGTVRRGRNKDLRLARTTYSVPVVLDMAAKALGF